MFTLAHLRSSFLQHVGLLVRADVYEIKTLHWYENHLKHLDGLADFPADALRLHHLAAIRLTNGFCRALKRMYRWAAEEELVPRDPFAKLATPACGERTRVLSRLELTKLYLASPRPLRRLLYAQFHTIARPGEIRCLTWGQIDWEKRVILLFKFKGKKRRRDKLRVRAIPLDQSVLRLLRNLYRKSPDRSADGVVFRSTKYSQAWTENAVRCAMRSARMRAGLLDGGERVVCYTLRHSNATNAVRAGLNLKVLAEIMGHARTSTTERYLHLDAGDVVEGIDQLRTYRPGPK